MDYVLIHGFAAHIKRSCTSTICGSMLLKMLRETKIYYFMQPANSNTLNAARYKDALDIQVDSKVCDANGLKYFSLNGNFRQMCALYPGACVAFSCDSKAKVHIVGRPFPDIN